MEDKIVSVLGDAQRGLSVTELASRLDIDRRTVAKHLEVMETKGIVEHESVGMAKLYKLTKSPLINLLTKKDEYGMVLQSILNSLDEGVSILDKNLRIIWVNDRIKKMAKKLSHLENRRCYETYVNRKDICARCPALKTFKSNKQHSSVEKGRDRSGKSYFYQFSTAPIKDRRGRTIAIIETVRDLSGTGY